MALRVRRCPRQAAASVKRHGQQGSREGDEVMGFDDECERCDDGCWRCYPWNQLQVSSPCQRDGEHNECNCHSCRDCGRKNLEAHRGFPQQWRKNQRGCDAVSDAGKTARSVDADRPNHPEAGIQDRDEEHRQFRNRVRFGDRSQQVRTCDSENCFAEDRHRARRRFDGRESPPSRGWARTLQKGF